MKVLPLLVFGSISAVMAVPPAPPPPADPLQQSIIRMVPKKKDATMDWLLDHQSLFSATREEFLKQYPKGTYTWLDKEKSRARFAPERVNIKLRGEECGETIVSFKEEKISGVIISMLNKGDDGYIQEGPYKKAINFAKGLLKEVAKVAESPRKKNETVSKADGLVWSTKQAMYMLEYLWTPEDRQWKAHAEFVRIRILPPQVLLGMQQNTMKVNVSRPGLAKRVQKEGTKVWLEGIPMVDQGSKGYCAVASFERVMRYYGSQVDMHDLAELTDSNGGGTSPGGMKDAVHKMAVRTGLRTREPIFMESKQFYSLHDAYNREAKKADLGTVEFNGVYNLYQEMDPELLKAMRLKDPGFQKFSSEVARSINAGIPLMWALQLGMFWEERLEDSFEANRSGIASDEDEEDDDEQEEEGDTPKTKPTNESPSSRPKRPPPGMGGGHLRLIIGFDAKERVIYYTDSWGPGHELKKMNLEEAWAVTMALFLLEP